MEKIIVNPEMGEDNILSSEVQSRMQDNGIILVYEQKNIIGSVILVNQEWTINTLDYIETYPYLFQAIEDNAQYIFKYIT